jgi:hypothetical protein
MCIATWRSLPRARTSSIAGCPCVLGIPSRRPRHSHRGKACAVHAPSTRQQRVIPARTLSAYRKTIYEIDGIEVRIGRRCPAMDDLLASYRVREAALITAHNPFSRVMPPGWNQRMQERLAEALWRRRILPAKGSWRLWSEAHLLVLGDARQLRRLISLFRQHGIVIVGRGQIARLMLGF